MAAVVSSCSCTPAIQLKIHASAAGRGEASDPEDDDDDDDDGEEHRLAIHISHTGLPDDSYVQVKTDSLTFMTDKTT